MQSTKRLIDKNFKVEFNLITDETTDMQQRLKQLQVKLKEKEHECKIAELKIKELKKQIPHPRLRQMPKL
jgi:sensor histidine kinase YesM